MIKSIIDFKKGIHSIFKTRVETDVLKMNRAMNRLKQTPNLNLLQTDYLE